MGAKNTGAALILMGALLGCAAPAVTPPPPQYEWRTVDNIPATDPKFVQTNQYCHGAAEARATAAPSLFALTVAVDGAYKACMAKAGYIWVPA
jgi:hypothetical protein